MEVKIIKLKTVYWGKIYPNKPDKFTIWKDFNSETEYASIHIEHVFGLTINKQINGFMCLIEFETFK